MPNQINDSFTVEVYDYLFKYIHTNIILCATAYSPSYLSREMYLNNLQIQ